MYKFKVEATDYSIAVGRDSINKIQERARKGNGFSNRDYFPERLMEEMPRIDSVSITSEHVWLTIQKDNDTKETRKEISNFIKNFLEGN